MSMQRVYAIECDKHTGVHLEQDDCVQVVQKLALWRTVLPAGRADGAADMSPRRRKWQETPASELKLWGSWGTWG